MDTFFDLPRNLSRPKDAPWPEIRENIYRQWPKLNTGGTWFLDIYGGIGDAVPILALGRAFRETHNVQKLVGFTKASFAPLTSMWSHVFDQFVFVDEKFELPQQYEFDFSAGNLIRATKMYVDEGRIAEMFVPWGVPCFDVFKYGMRISLVKDISYPVVPIDVQSGITSLADQLGFVEGRTAILCPFSNFGSRLDPLIWVELAKQLHDRGFQLFTNCANKVNFSVRKSQSRAVKMDESHVIQESYEPILGTLALNVPVDVLYALAEYGGYTFSNNAGIAFLLGLSRAKNCVLYPDKKISARIFSSSYPKDSLFTPLDMWYAVSRSIPDRHINEILVNTTKDKKLWFAETEPFNQDGLVQP